MFSDRHSPRPNGVHQMVVQFIAWSRFGAMPMIWTSEATIETLRGELGRLARQRGRIDSNAVGGSLKEIHRLNA